MSERKPASRLSGIAFIVVIAAFAFAAVWLIP